MPSHFVDCQHLMNEGQVDFFPYKGFIAQNPSARDFLHSGPTISTHKSLSSHGFPIFISLSVESLSSISASQC